MCTFITFSFDPHSAVPVQLYQDFSARYSYHTCINKKLWTILLFQSKGRGEGSCKGMTPPIPPSVYRYVYTFSLKTKTERSIICFMRASAFILSFPLFLFLFSRVLRVATCCYVWPLQWYDKWTWAAFFKWNLETCKILRAKLFYWIFTSCMLLNSYPIYILIFTLTMFYIAHQIIV